MAIDFTLMREKLTKLQNRGDSKNNFWKPQDGDQTIRIVPTADGDPFKEYWFHYNLGKNPGFLCPKKNHGKGCPVCDFAWHIMKEAKQNNDADTLKLSKSLLPRQRFFSPVYVRGEEDKGVRIWGYGKLAYENLIQLVLNPDYGDITDVETGTDLVLNYGKPPGASFPVTKLQPRRRTSPLIEGSDTTQTQEALDSIPEFKDLFEVKETSEIENMLDTFLSGESNENPEEGSSETAKYNNTSTKDASEVEAAFKELLA